MEAPGPPYFLTKDEFDTGGQGQRSSSSVVSFPATLIATTSKGENAHREVDDDVEQPQAAQG